MEQIKLYIRTNAISQWIKYSFTLKQIQFKLENNNYNKSNFTLKKFNFTFKESGTMGDFWIMVDF